MAIDWKAFYANGGYSNENSDPQSYDDEDDYDDEYIRYDDQFLLVIFTRKTLLDTYPIISQKHYLVVLNCCNFAVEGQLEVAIQ